MLHHFTIFSQDALNMVLLHLSIPYSTVELIFS